VKRLVRLLVFAAAAWVPAASCGTIAVGDVFLITAGNGTTQFFLDNFTGAADGCSTPAGFPVCTDVSISGILTYSYFDGSGTVNGTATLALPIGPNADNGGASYAPSNFQLPTTTVLSATFSGSLTPANLTADTGPFPSDGTVVSLDVVAGGGFALLNTNSAPTTIPEPSTAVLVVLGGLALVSNRRRERDR
jgi:hypothetical protein